VRFGVRLGERLNETARHGLAFEPGDEVGEIVLCFQVVAEVLDPRRRAVGVGGDAHGDHRFEIAIVLDAHDRETFDGL
jgi:hypothetical protein